jgi:hypothetical protein
MSAAQVAVPNCKRTLDSTRFAKNDVLHFLDTNPQPDDGASEQQNRDTVAIQSACSYLETERRGREPFCIVVYRIGLGSRLAYRKPFPNLGESPCFPAISVVKSPLRTLTRFWRTKSASLSNGRLATVCSGSPSRTTSLSGQPISTVTFDRFRRA